MVKNLIEKEDERESSRVAKFQPPITFILIFINFSFKVKPNESDFYYPKKSKSRFQKNF